MALNNHEKGLENTFTSYKQVNKWIAFDLYCTFRQWSGVEALDAFTRLLNGRPLFECIWKDLLNYYGRTLLPLLLNEKEKKGYKRNKAYFSHEFTICDT